MGNSCACIPKSSVRNAPVRETSPNENKKRGTYDQCQSATDTPRLYVKSESGEKEIQLSPHTAATESEVVGAAKNETVVERHSERYIELAIIDTTIEKARDEDEMEKSATERIVESEKINCCDKPQKFEAGDENENLSFGKGRKRRRSTEDGGKKTTKKRKPTRSSMIPSVSKASPIALVTDSLNSHADSTDSPLLYYCNNKFLMLKTFNNHHRQQQLSKSKTSSRYNFSYRQLNDRVGLSSRRIVELNKKDNRKRNRRKQQMNPSCCNENLEFSVTNECISEEKKLEAPNVLRTSPIEVEDTKNNLICSKLHQLLFELPTSIDEDLAMSSNCNTPSNHNSSRCSGVEIPQYKIGEESELQIPSNMSDYSIDLSRLLPSINNSLSKDSPYSPNDSRPPATERQLPFQDPSSDPCNNKPRPSTAMPNLQQIKYSAQKKASSVVQEKSNIQCSASVAASAAAAFASQTIQ